MCTCTHCPLLGYRRRRTALAWLSYPSAGAVDDPRALAKHARTQRQPLGDCQSRGVLQSFVTERHPESLRSLFTAPSAQPGASKRDPWKLGADSLRGCANSHEGPRALLQRSRWRRVTASVLPPAPDDYSILLVDPPEHTRLRNVARGLLEGSFDDAERDHRAHGDRAHRAGSQAAHNRLGRRRGGASRHACDAEDDGNPRT